MKHVFKINLGIFLLSIVVMLGSCKAQKMTSDQLMAQNYHIIQIGEKEVSDAKLTLKVDPVDLTLSGYAGCNNYNYSYKLKDRKLDLGYASATKMYCEDSMDVESLFFQKMASVTQFENSKEEIYFINEDEDIVIKAKKKD